jgi:hypothetical protein
VFVACGSTCTYLLSSLLCVSFYVYTYAITSFGSTFGLGTGSMVINHTIYDGLAIDKYVVVHCIVACRVRSCHVSRVRSCHVSHVMSCHVMSCRVVSCVGCVLVALHNRIS